MQNSSLSLVATLCLSTALFVSPVYAQNAAGKTDSAQPAANAEVKQPKQEQSGQSAQVKPNKPAQAPGKQQTAPNKGKQQATPNKQPAKQQAAPNKQEQNAKPATKSDSFASAEDASKMQERKLLEAELNNTEVDSTEILDFPARTSLGEMEMATLPGAKESLITGPASMAPSVSTKDLPSEQLLGRITSEVFQEMADLERGNVFLKLQMQKEQLKNDLEKLKASYRQSRLEEIAKREDVVRSRIAWWQEQEAARLEMEKKKAETEAVEQQIAEAEELRNKLREEAAAEKEAAERRAAEAAEAAKKVQPVVEEAPAKSEPEKKEKEEVKIPSLSELYVIVSVRGMKTDLKATLKNVKDGTLQTVKKNDILPSGHQITELTRESVVSVIDGRQDVLLLTVKTPENKEAAVEDDSTSK